MLLVWTVWWILKLNSRFQNVISDPFPSEMVFCGNEQACLNEGWELMFLSPKDNPNWSKYGTLLCTALLANFIWNVLPARASEAQQYPESSSSFEMLVFNFESKIETLESVRFISPHWATGLHFKTELDCFYVLQMMSPWLQLNFSFLASPHLVSSLISSFVFSSPLISSKLVL